MLKNLFLTVLMLALMLVPMQLRTLLEARSHLKTARQYAAESKVNEAIIEYRKAIAWSSPFNAAARQARAELTELAHRPTLSPEQKLRALEELMRGLQTSRNFFTPRHLRTDDAEVGSLLQEIQQLRGIPNLPNSLSPVEKPEINYRAQILTQCFFWGWVLAAGWSIVCGFDKSGRPITSQLRRGGAITALSYLLWLCALAT